MIAKITRSLRRSNSILRKAQLKFKYRVLLESLFEKVSGCIPEIPLKGSVADIFSEFLLITQDDFELTLIIIK